MSKTKKPEFWVSNISDRNVSLRDLGITIPSRKVTNLLDDRHYSFNYEQLKLSATSGSLYSKRDKIIIRQLKPEAIITPGIQVSTIPRFVAQNMARTKIIVEDVQYDELIVSEEEFADEMTNE